MEHLDIKETALDDLDLPVKLKFGYLSKLVLKIPWTAISTPTRSLPTSKDFIIIVVPNKGSMVYSNNSRAFDFALQE